MLHRLKHENIVKLLGMFSGERTGLVLELMAGGSLYDLLYEHLHVQYFTCHVLSWAQQVAAALSYLHRNGYLHRDLKSNNLLLSNDYITLKLCDFGTVAQLRSSMTNNRGTAYWMAPEVFRGKKYDQKCDIFSFGLLLWEIFTRSLPYAKLDLTAGVLLYEVSQYGLRPPKIPDSPTPIMELIERCWEDNAEKRPDVQEVVGIVDVLCEIYPHRNLPLVDSTTRQQAFAHPAERSPYYPSLRCYSTWTKAGRGELIAILAHRAYRHSVAYSFRAATRISIYGSPNIDFKNARHQVVAPKEAAPEPVSENVPQPEVTENEPQKHVLLDPDIIEEMKERNYPSTPETAAVHPSAEDSTKEKLSEVVNATRFR